MREWGGAGKTHAPRVSGTGAEQKVDRWLTAEEEERLMARIFSRGSEIMIFCTQYGRASGRDLEPQWRDVDFSRHADRDEKQNGTRRTIPLNTKGL